MIYDNFAFPDFRKELIHPGREIFVRIRAIASDTTRDDGQPDRSRRVHIRFDSEGPISDLAVMQSSSSPKSKLPARQATCPWPRPRAREPGPGPTRSSSPFSGEARAQPRKALSFRRFGLQFQILKPQPLYASPQPNRILWWNFQGALVGGALLLLYIVDAAVG